MRLHAQGGRRWSQAVKVQSDGLLCAQNQVNDNYRAIIDRKQSTCVFGHAQNQLWGSVYRNTNQISYDVVSLPFLSYVIRELKQTRRRRKRERHLET